MARVPTRSGEGDVLPRYIFLEPLIADSRVLEVGAVSATAGHSARFLLERKAKSVLAIDDDVGAVEPEAKVEGATFSTEDYRELGQGEFDLVVLHRAESLAQDFG